MDRRSDIAQDPIKTEVEFLLSEITEKEAIEFVKTVGICFVQISGRTQKVCVLYYALVRELAKKIANLPDAETPTADEIESFFRQNPRLRKLEALIAELRPVVNEVFSQPAFPGHGVRYLN